jgi:hypothetical protein
MVIIYEKDTSTVTAAREQDDFVRTFQKKLISHENISNLSHANVKSSFTERVL